MNRIEAVHESPHPRSASGLDREVVVLGAVVVLGTIMTVLDLTVVNVAIPTLGRDLEASISTIQWVMTGYMLAFASVIPVTGSPLAISQKAQGIPRYRSKSPW